MYQKVYKNVNIHWKIEVKQKLNCRIWSEWRNNVGHTMVIEIIEGIAVR